MSDHPSCGRRDFWVQDLAGSWRMCRIGASTMERDKIFQIRWSAGDEDLVNIATMIWKPEFSLINRLINWEIPGFSSFLGEFIFSGHSDAKEHLLLETARYREERPLEIWKDANFVDKKAGPRVSFLPLPGCVTTSNLISHVPNRL